MAAPGVNHTDRALVKSPGIMFDTAMEHQRLEGAPVTLTATIADHVRALRTEARLSGAALAAAMQARGVPWNRTTVAKLETGKRETVTVQELLALAVVFGVPPALLLADPRQAGPIPIAEGVELGAWEALLWMIGSSTIGGGIASHPISSTTVELIWHGRQVAEWAGAIESTPVRPGTQLRMSRDGETMRVRPADEVHRGYLEMIAGSLERIKELGAPAPQLGPKVLKRGVELDVKLPGQGGEG